MRKLLLKIFNYLPHFNKTQKNRHLVIFTAEKKTWVIRQLGEIMEVQRPYLHEGYTVKSLADELNIRQYQLSAFLNHELGVNFNDYLNQQRIRHCQQLIHEGEAYNLNLKGLASKCGFHNRNTFSTAFKKFTGYTPSSYTKRYYKASAPAA
jgi:AraC-like DNA-binding protein